MQTHIQFLQSIRQIYSLQQNLQSYSLINFYANFLEQITLDYWEDQTEEYPIYQYYFEQSYQSINEIHQKHSTITVKQFTYDQLFDLYDKLVDLASLQIKSNYLTAFAMQYHNIYRMLNQQARKDLSDRRDQLIFIYQSQEIRKIKLKLKNAIESYNVGDIAYMLFYDLYQVEVLKQPQQGYHQILEIVDEVIIEYFEEQYKLAEQLHNNAKNKLLSKNIPKQPISLEKFKKDCFLTIMHMRMKQCEPYLKFIKTYLKL